MKKLISTFFLSILIGLSAIFATCEKSKCQEKKDSNCVCTMQYDPVCGCNNKTYGNACEAECSGIKEYAKGECK